MPGCILIHYQFITLVVVMCFTCSANVTSGTSLSAGTCSHMYCSQLGTSTTMTQLTDSIVTDLLCFNIREKLIHFKIRKVQSSSSNLSHAVSHFTVSTTSTSYRGLAVHPPLVFLRVQLLSQFCCKTLTKLMEKVVT